MQLQSKVTLYESSQVDGDRIRSAGSNLGEKVFSDIVRGLQTEPAIPTKEGKHRQLLGIDMTCRTIISEGLKPLAI